MLVEYSKNWYKIETNGLLHYANGSLIKILSGNLSGQTNQSHENFPNLFSMRHLKFKAS